MIVHLRGAAATVDANPGLPTVARKREGWRKRLGVELIQAKPI